MTAPRNAREALEQAAKAIEDIQRAYTARDKFPVFELWGKLKTAHQDAIRALAASLPAEAQAEPERGEPWVVTAYRWGCRDNHSYSRWSNSRWYTFWCVQPRDQRETRASAIFEVCAIQQFSAAELRKDLDKCAELCAAKEGNATQEELEELKGYMRDFLSNVDERYPNEHSRSNP